MVAPSLLCIGAQKSGTTWLYDNLACHPDVWLPPLKEIHYFNRLCMNKELLGYWELPNARGVGRYKDALLKGNLSNLKWLSNYYSYGMSAQWYLSLFDQRFTRGKKTADITPDYSTLGEDGVKYAMSVVGKETPVLFILRNPVERSWSAAKMIFRYRGLGIEEKNYNELEALLKHPIIMEYSRYCNAIKLWSKYFSKVSVLTYDELCASPEVFLSEVAGMMAIEDCWDQKTIANRVWADTQKIEVPERFKNFLTEQYSSEIALLSELVDSHFVDAWAC